ncbi:hypothetical protein [Chitinophaga solisilvae]|uniref:Uncharacterized protein n=1 Tax=Chitinophaga solisilvae TaxID=1233460 RepID=A0A433WIF2_9BACT|nr:hypothetical protein [Chitinophaga solisilvae]NSL89964.1 hypothetical protein [Chitinophaga solisilvae]
MSTFVRKLLWALLVPLGIALIAVLSGDEGIIGAGLLLMFVVPAYVVVGVILLIVKHEEIGKALLLSAGIMLLVGLSTCGLILASM